MRRKGLLFALGLLCGALLLVVCLINVLRLVRPGRVKLLTTEVSLGKLDPEIGFLLGSLRASPDSKRVAYAAARGGRQAV
jgi:hypothetical protein